MNLLGTLGLDSVEADPNHIPDGKYGAVVEDSSYVNHKAKGAPEGAVKDHISHVIKYKINDGGDQNGKTKDVWYPICKVVQFAEDGKSPAVIDGRPAVEPTMKETAKPWYKKALMALGVEEHEIPNLNPESLKGLPVTLGIKNKDGFTNVSFVELRQVAQEQPQTASSIFGTFGTL